MSGGNEIPLITFDREKSLQEHRSKSSSKSRVEFVVKTSQQKELVH